MIFNPGDKVVFHPKKGIYRAKNGDCAIVQDPTYQTFAGRKYLYVNWIDEKIGQTNGGYSPNNFKLVVQDTFEEDGIE